MLFIFAGNKRRKLANFYQHIQNAIQFNANEWLASHPAVAAPDLIARFTAFCGVFDKLFRNGCIWYSLANDSRFSYLKNAKNCR